MTLVRDAATLALWDELERVLAQLQRRVQFNSSHDSVSPGIENGHRPHAAPLTDCLLYTSRCV